MREGQVTSNKRRFAFQNKTGSRGTNTVQVPHSELTGNNSGTREQQKRPWGSTPVLCHRAQQNQLLAPLSPSTDPEPKCEGSCAQVHQLSFIPEVPLRELQFCHTIFNLWEAKASSKRKVLFAKDPPSGLKAAEKPDVLTWIHLLHHSGVDCSNKLCTFCTLLFSYSLFVLHSLLHTCVLWILRMAFVLPCDLPCAPKFWPLFSHLIQLI